MTVVVAIAGVLVYALLLHAHPDHTLAFVALAGVCGYASGRGSTTVLLLTMVCVLLAATRPLWVAGAAPPTKGGA